MLPSRFPCLDHVLLQDAGGADHLRLRPELDVVIPDANGPRARSECTSVQHMPGVELDLA